MKPDGIVGIIDHAGLPGNTREIVNKLHRIDPAVVKADFEKAGFDCGVYGYPIPEAARIALTTVKSFVESHPQIELVRFVLFSDDVLQTFRNAAGEVL